MKCKGKNRQGLSCGKNAMRGRDYCRTHGGTKPIGPIHHLYKHGRRSKYLPSQLAARYAEVISDPELADHRHSIAVLEMRQDELLARGESYLLWDKARDAFEDLMVAIRAQDTTAMNAGLRVLDDLFRRGSEDSLRWREWYEVTERHSRIVEREHKRLAQLEAYIAVEQLVAMMGMIANAAANTISDQDSLRRFKSAIDAIWMGGGLSGH